MVNTSSRNMAEMAAGSAWYTKKQYRPRGLLACTKNAG